MAWVMAGWNRPPWAECFSLWVGRTWPEVKKLEKNLCGGLVQLLLVRGNERSRVTDLFAKHIS